ncbi:NUDIX hydrolase [Rhodococcus triatomae]|uniref:8-oxo-dGTP diphosphatase n=1 Tax=Rhodococcus triatomae TaxID=300028 RepID=A0A1G8EPT8_9NOCA|nr:NUDIX hydrolase [Rhodococcus triatomae]QNG19258.1 NUDIX hydrolase [Rhodococcus triatomae]QNG24829.1 NUDIX hydrolase [Rhodococcus triatomae]SDH71872.1 8-oxo-dGTP diphosphatase [Rhodococcus triatomae]
MGSSSGKQVKANIFAAGAVIWRRPPDSPHGVEVALIHRPKYDDWSFPKGKLDPGETSVVAAVREVREETGFEIRLGRYLRAETYPIPGHRKLKRVEYWAAQITEGHFRANDEVDELRWLTPEHAADQLSYPMDRKILRRFLAMDPDTDTLLLVRHAKAGSRKRYRGDDAERPLDAEGTRQAEALVAQLRAFDATEVSAADRVRCVRTVEPLAESLATPVHLEPALTEESYTADPAVGRERMLEIASRNGVQVVCSQGGVIPDLMQWWADRDGLVLPPARNRKASTWVLSLREGRLVAADHLDSPLPRN